MLRPNLQTQRKIKKITTLSQTAAVVAAVGIALVTGVATFLLLPKFGISFAIAVGCAGLVIELKTYWHDTQKAATVIFVKGIFSNLENNLITREVLKNKTVADLFALPDIVQSSKKLTKKWIKRKLEDDNNNFSSSKILNEIKTNLQKELVIKKTLCAIALIYVIFNGISTTAITYTHTNLVIQQLALRFFNVTLFTNILTFIFAVVCGYAYSQIMYRLLARMIEKNSLRKLFHSLKKAFTPSKSFREMLLSEYFSFSVKCFTTASLFLSILTLSILVTFFSGTTLLNQNIVFLQAIINLFTHLNYSTQVAINVTSAILIYGFFLPTAFLFAFENSWETVHGVIKKITSFLKEPQNLKNFIVERIALIKSDPKQCWKLPGYTVGFFIVAIALILHVVGEGARSSESLINRSRLGLQTLDRISAFFEKIVDTGAQIFNISPTLFTLSSESILEILEHLPFLQGHHHGSSVTTFCAENSYHLINYLFSKNAFKKPQEVPIDLEKAKSKINFSSLFKKPTAEKPIEIQEQEIELLIQPTSSF